MTAARCGRGEILDLLVCCGANVNQVGEHVTSFGSSTGVRWTALTMAARRGHGKIVQRLLCCADIQTHFILEDFIGS